MTTIVYDHKENKIAVDGRSTKDNIITTDTAIKVVKREGEIFFLAGCPSDREKFFRLYSGEDLDPSKIEITGLLVRGFVGFEFGLCEITGYWEEKLSHNVARGSGGNWAISALDFGKTAYEAIEYAKTKDCQTGGAITVYSVATMEECDIETADDFIVPDPTTCHLMVTRDA